MKKIVFLLFLAFLCAGCGPSIKRYPISGEATYNGQPIPHGGVRFTPDSSRGNSGPQTYVSIVDGRYDSGKDGTVGGPMIVEIDGSHQFKETDAGLLGQSLFDSHEERIELPKKTTTYDFNVTGPPLKIIP